jgi:hypothetical protein
MGANTYDRRSFMGYFAGIGLGSTLLPGVLWAEVARGVEITAATIAAAEELAGLTFDDAERAMMVDGLKLNQSRIEALHKVPLLNSVSPALVFDPLPPGKSPPREPKRAMVRTPVAARAVPSDEDELAFLPVTELSELIRRRRITSLQLTNLYLSRLK